MTASRYDTARHDNAPDDGTPWYEHADDPTTRHRAVGIPATNATAAAPAARRSVSARVAAVIGVVAFLLGAGIAMLTGPLLGLGGGPGGPGGAGGAPGTSQQSGTGSSATTSSGTGSSTTGT